MFSIRMHHVSINRPSDIQYLGDKLYTNSPSVSFWIWDLLTFYESMKHVCIQKLVRMKNQWPATGKPIMSVSPSSNPNPSNQVRTNLWNTTEICGERCSMWWRPYFSAAGEWRRFGMWWQFLWSVGARPLGWSEHSWLKLRNAKTLMVMERNLNNVLHIWLKC